MRAADLGDMLARLKNCRPDPRCPPEREPCDEFTVAGCDPEILEGLNSGDPNGKFGPIGATVARHVQGTGGLSYIVMFENEPIASAAAHEVLMQDVLDTLVFERGSVTFDYVVVAGQVRALVGDPSAFEVTLDLRPGRNALVHCVGWTEPATNTIVVRLETLDPATGRPPEDPRAGFLPPNVISPEGEGAIGFTVLPKVGIEGGSTFANYARIIFDGNAPIVTPVWTNVLDSSPPVSQVLALPAVSNDSVLTVSWVGSDEGSGIATFDVYVAEDGGRYRPWRIGTSATRDTIHVAEHRCYTFFSVGVDSVGLRETAPLAPDASTCVPVEAVASLVNARAIGDSVFVEWRVSASLGQVSVESNRNSAGWLTRVLVTPGSGGIVVFTDREAAPGDSVGYRIRGQGGQGAPLAEVWVEVPVAVRFGITILGGNPARGGSVIRCGLPEPGAASLEVLDVAGRRLRSFPIWVARAGWVELSLDETLPSGAYFVRLQAGARRTSKKLLVLN
jgi:hypothetical protein